MLDFTQHQTGGGFTGSPRQIKGARYLDGHAVLDLRKLVTSELPYCDWREAVEWYRELDPYLRPQDRAFLACNDRFYLMTCLLGRVDIVHPWLYDRCREVEADPDGYLDLWAREHGKSSLITFGGTIQEVLSDPELTVAIFSYTQKAARKFLHQIRQEFERNELLRQTFPDVLWTNPRKEAPAWGNEGIVLKRQSNPKEGTIEAWGLLDGMPTGGHYKLMIYDDVVTQKGVTNPQMVAKATEQWELSDNLGAAEVRKWHIGTRYSFGDTWGQILERRVLKPRIYPGSDDGTPTGTPVFMSLKRWAEKLKTQRRTFAAQMLQNPLAGTEQVFRPEWFMARWEVRPLRLNVYIMCDPSAGRRKGSDNTAIAVIGIDSGGSKYLLDGYCHRMALSERWSNLRMLYRRWSNAPGVAFVKVGYERYGMQADLEYFEERMRLDGSSFAITELAWPSEGPHSKISRIERLEPDIRNKRFLFPAVMSVRGVGDCYWHMASRDSADGTRNQIVTLPCAGPTKRMQRALDGGHPYMVVKALRRQAPGGEVYDVTRVLIEELLYFPFAPHDDIVDAASRIYDMDPISASLDEDARVEELNDFGFEDA